MTMSADDQTQSDKVGFRDIYRAVGESESRIKEHVSLVLLPITQAVADHEKRISDHEDRLVIIEDRRKADVTIRVEQRRLLGLSNKGLAIIIVAVNTVATVAVLIWNFVAGLRPA